MSNTNRSLWGIARGPALVLALLALLGWTPAHGQTTTSHTIWLPLVLSSHAGPRATPTRGSSPAPTASATITIGATASATASATATPTIAVGATATPTAAATAGATASATATPTITLGATASATASATATPSPLPTATPGTNPVHQGIATYYYATGAGACLFDPSPDDLMVAAMNADEYDTAGYCGAYVHVSGPTGAVDVRIVDLCPECQAGHLDLSLEAFARIAPVELGRVPITWQLISPALTGPIAYHFKDGSNEWWTAVQVRNHRNPIAKLEYLAPGGQWAAVPRTEYNYFVQTNPGMGPGPYTFRVTDIYGHVLTDSNIPHVEMGTVNGAAQFPPAP